MAAGNMLFMVALAIYHIGAERVSNDVARAQREAANHTVEIQSHYSSHRYCSDKQVCCLQTLRNTARTMTHYCEAERHCHKQRHEFFSRHEVTYEGSERGRHTLKNNLCDATSEVSRKHEEICKERGDVCCVDETAGEAKKIFMCKAAGACVPTRDRKLRIAEGNELTEDGQCPTAAPRKRPTMKEAPTISLVPEGPPAQPLEPSCSDGQSVCCRKEGAERDDRTRDSESYTCKAQCDKDETEAQDGMNACVAQMTCQKAGFGSRAIPSICCGTRKSADPEGIFGCWSPRACRELGYKIAETEEELRPCLG